jgi:hypothetical protein
MSPASALIPLAFSPVGFAGEHVMAIVGILIVVGGLAIFGISDIARFRLRRVLAISDVCFAESVRRKVLLLVPLAVLGLVAIVQLQQPLDALDSIRQTTKFCILTTGLVVITSSLILACTNLPREIENKVIFTVVTKPATRLEIILGKIVGFSQLSGTILLLMGIFSFGYLHLRAWSMERDLKTRLANNAVEPISRPTFQHYVDDHLLSAKQLDTPVAVNIFNAEPADHSFNRYPTPGGNVLVRFKLPNNMLAISDPEGKVQPVGIRVVLLAGYDTVPGKVDEETKRLRMPQTGPEVTVQIFDPSETLVIGREINGGKPFPIPDPKGHQVISFDIPPNYAANLTKYPFIYVSLTVSGGNYRVWIPDDPDHPPVYLKIPVVNGDKVEQQIVGPAPFPGEIGNGIKYRGRQGQTGEQIAGDANSAGQVAVAQFRNEPVAPGPGGTVPIEFRVGVEKSGESNDQDVMTQGSLTIVNTKTGYRSAPVIVMPENNRVSYASAPAAAFDGGDYDVQIRCLSPGQWLNILNTSGNRSLAVVKSVDSFAVNLFKSIFILWLLSILVITISVFCSTFLSWPIAVVLSVVLLLGKWTLDELGDAATAGLGRSIAVEMQLTDPTVAQTISENVERLNSTLKMVSSALPDIGQFPATDDIDQGISIPLASIVGGLGVLAAFGIPLTVLAYIFLKNKEVAP